MSLAGSRIVIIGGGSGMGLATAKLASQAGADVVIAGRTLEKLERAREEIGGNVEVRRVDIRAEDQLEALFDELGAIDHLTTPGTRGMKGVFPEVETQAVRETFESKFWGQYMAAKHAVPHIRPGGSIVFVTGVYAHRPPKGRHVLAAMNGGIEALARALAIDVAPLRVNVVAPGMMDTALYDEMGPAQKKAMFDELAARLPVGHIGTPEDAAKAILYLMDNPYVTGTTLHVDGGLSLK